MPDIQIKITNLPQIKAAFKRAPLLMSKNLNLAIRKSVLSIGRDSRINTPVLTGRLRASHRESFSNLRGEVGPSTNYAIFVHEGTRYMKARPFLRTAVEKNEGIVNRFFTKAVDDTLREIGSKV